MRVTNRMMVNSHQRNLNRNLGRLQRAENQMITGRLVNRPSDNPVNATRIMGYNNQLARNEQLSRNIREAQSFNDAADSALTQVNEQLQQIRELTLRASNGHTHPDIDLGAMADEVEELTRAIMQFMNATHGEQFIFGGSVTDRPPFELVDGQVVYQGNEDVRHLGVAPGTSIAQNIPGSSLMGTEPNIFETLNQLSQAIREGDTDQLQELMPELDQQIANVRQNHTRVGLIQNRLESSLTSVQNTNLNIIETLSRIQDVDIAEQAIELAILETTYMITVQIASQISRPTLMDFLR